MSTSDDEFADELEQDDEIEQDEADEVIEAEADIEEGEVVVANSSTSASAKAAEAALEEEAQLRTVTSRDSVRQQLEDQIKQFLSRGGQIEQLAPDDSAKA